MTGFWLWPGGRVSRRGFVLLYVLPTVCFRGLLELFGYMPDVRFPMRFLLAAGAAFMALLVVGLAKRLHDCDRSGWWALLALVPVVGWIAVVLMCVDESSPGPNRAGRVPLDLIDSRW